jgi:predicted translin family RNA/ssDNA-binding protein
LVLVALGILGLKRNAGCEMKKEEFKVEVVVLVVGWMEATGEWRRMLMTVLRSGRERR